MNLETLPFVPCNHRTPRPGRVDLIVIHTNEGQEGPNAAENLARYLQTVDPGYHVVVDENSAVRCALDNQVVWGAGGVNARAWHLCLTGYAAQTAEQWADASSRGELAIAADLTAQACRKLDVPMVRVTDTRYGGPRGICGHGDVSAFHSSSLGHTDPGPHFPWDGFLAAVTGGTTDPAPPPPAPKEDVPVWIDYGGRLSGFYISHDGKLWQRHEGNPDDARAPKRKDISAEVGFATLDASRGTHPRVAPNLDLIVGVYGTDGVYNEARWLPEASRWVPVNYT